MDRKLRVIIGSNLQKERKKQRYSQQDIAEAVDVSTNYYATIERGEAIPSLVTLFEIIEFLDVDTTKILPKKI